MDFADRVPDFYIQYLLEQYPVKHWANISEVCVGKPFTMIHNRPAGENTRVKLRRRDNDETVDARPTLLVVPAQLEVQTFSEAYANFPELDFRVFYGTRSTILTADSPGTKRRPTGCPTGCPAVRICGKEDRPRHGTYRRHHVISIDLTSVCC